ncbi:MAG: (2Fe-2S)-binding protein [Acidobacteria bacterium]|nr:(2Fe-2S)-binding protein [Acidobacteriota bacterium]
MRDQIPLVPIEVKVNGKSHKLEVEPRMLLVELLRDGLGLTGTHIGCDTTYCGACTVLLNGNPVKSCTVFAVQADQGEIMTVEGLAKDGQLHPLQSAFSEQHALQCGYCTPGMLMSSYSLLSKSPSVTDKDIVKGIAGNVCRCTGYQNIVKAIQLAAQQTKGR